MDFYPKVKIVWLDIDGTSIRSGLASLDGKYLDWTSNIPILKKTILGIVELTERVLPVKYELIDLQREKALYLYQAIKNADFNMIVTDRSIIGVNTVLNRLPAFKTMIEEYGISHIQVRESILSEKFNLKKIKIIKSKSIKPDKNVFCYLDCFARKRMIKQEEILVADDNYHIRAIAKKQGKQIYPDNIIVETSQVNMEKPLYTPHSL